ncbi:ABC transporter substrate-binding protein [Streptomyces longispororuber]|uniref:ABC transporter substrate-binding protein n=1 Tax=Streptomyces longispororuber TaxID=68230 RepID=UPI002109C471|nr:ABC transporter substrate-binding protein [Streptomyces longispororuber]MCQ4213410.1 ABC transporter substrate-binding protein [Streptomyces longispororuber]
MTTQSGGDVSRRRVLALTGGGLGLLAGSGLLAACAPKPADDGDGGSSAARGADAVIDRLTLALPSSISTLDVGRESGVLNYVVATLAQEALLSVSPTGELGPGLATRWKQPDTTTYVFTLRRGVTFSDGTAFTADDVVATVEEIRDPDNGNALSYAYAGVQSVKATGDHEVTITLKQPDASFLWNASPGGMLISSRKFLTRNRGRIGTARTLLLGTGPYRITEFAADDHVLLERNPKWWGDKPALQKLTLSFVPDSGTRLVAMKSHEIDGALGLATDEAASWKSAADVTYTGDRSVVSLAFDTSKAPWNDPHVRRAVAHAADRDGMVDGILRKKAQTAAALPSRDMWGDLLSAAEVDKGYAAIPDVPFDLDKARAELARSSAKDGFAAELHYPNSGPQLGKAALALAASLKKIGIELKVKEITLEQWVAELGSGKQPLQFLWYFPVTGDPAELLDPYLNAASTATNIAHYDNADVNSALDRAKKATDKDERAALLMKAVQAAGTDLPYLPLWWAQTASALSDTYVLLEPGPFALIGPWATRVRKAA